MKKKDIFFIHRDKRSSGGANVLCQMPELLATNSRIAFSVSLRFALDTMPNSKNGLRRDRL
jgi:hypothetical protein